MLVILSQKIDSESTYADELFNAYHYPAKYKNQLHKGDTFIYYQGNRFDKDQRYYFGVGTVGEILSADGENYYAKLINCQQFAKKVPIYLPDGGYIEQLGYETVRNSINPPWQSSIRPISQMAFDYILNTAGVQQSPDALPTESLDSMKDKLKQAVKAFYVEGDRAAIHRIEGIAAAIGRAIDVNDEPISAVDDEHYMPEKTSDDKMGELLDYCKNMRMSYSYKPVLILALLHHGDKNGRIKIEKAAKYFREFYAARRQQGLCVEKKKCIYLREDVTDAQIISNLISNPVKALADSGLFFFNEESKTLSVSPEIWNAINRKYRSAVTRLCNQKLHDYYGERWDDKNSADASKDSNERENQTLRRNGFYEVCDNACELKRILPFGVFKVAFDKFIEQADLNAKTGKSNGSRTLYGLPTPLKGMSKGGKLTVDGGALGQQFGQGAASKNPYINWHVVSIYYVYSMQKIVLGIEPDRYAKLSQMSGYETKTIEGKKSRIAVFYECNKATLNYEKLYERFLEVSENVMKLGLE